MCKTASQKVHVLGRISTLMSFNQRKTIINAFITSQFNTALLYGCVTPELWKHRLIEFMKDL